MPGLEDLYREIILDHYRNPRNRGELAGAPRPSRAEGFNPLCGDEIVVYLELDDDGGRSTDIRIGGQGCSISQSSASMMSAAVKGKIGRRGPGPDPRVQGDDVDPRGRRSRPRATEADGGGRGSRATLKLGDLEALQGVVKFPVRIKCATLAWNTLAQGLDEATSA